MPYPEEFAHKLGHVPLVVSPQVRRLMLECSPQAPTEPEFVRRLPQHSALSIGASPGSAHLRVLALDGTRVELESGPSRLGLIQLGQIEFCLGDYRRLASQPLVDPFAVARLERRQKVWDVALPSNGVHWAGQTSVRDSVRAAMHELLQNTYPAGEHNLLDTLFALAARRPGPLATEDPTRIRLHRCPHCDRGPVTLLREEVPAECPCCQGTLYPADTLRLHEEVNETEPNLNLLTRFMTALEHLVLSHQVEFLAEKQPELLAHTALFLDGPLALFGPASWLYAPLQQRYDEISRQLRAAGLGSLLLIGIQKSGPLLAHAQQLRPHLPPGAVFAVDDDYRYRFVLTARQPNQDGFGRQSYFGQDFVYRSQKGSVFTFGLLYPVPHKNAPDFHAAKVATANYPQIPLVLGLLEELSSSRLAGALVPTLLAHRATAISRRPGDRVLTLHIRSLLGQAHRPVHHAEVRATNATSWS